MIKKAIGITLISLLLLIIFIYWYESSLDQKAKNANVIIVSVDALRANHMGVYGYKKDTTPNIDLWSKDTFIFDNAMTAIPITYPSFASLFTGLPPVNTRIIENSTRHIIGDNTQTLASIFKRNGFTNVAYLTSDVLNKDINKGITNLAKDFDIYESFPYKNDQVNNYRHYEEFISKAFSWLRTNKDKRFFMWLHLMNTHPPYFPPKNYRCVFNQKYCKEIDNSNEQELIDDEKKYRGCRKQAVPEDRVEIHETLYDGEIAYMDNLFGQFIDVLKKIGIDKNTVVVFLADHGEGFDHNYNFLHGRVLYNSSVRIPLIIKIPWINPQGTRIPKLIDNSDIMPTLIDLLKLRIDYLVTDGNSFGDVFKNKFNRFFLKTNETKQFVYLVSQNMDKYAVTDGKYIYIYSLPGSCGTNDQTMEEVYNLSTDPGEKNNLVLQNLPENKELKEMLMSFLSRYNLPQTPLKIEDTDSQNNPQLEKLKSLGY